MDKCPRGGGWWKKSWNISKFLCRDLEMKSKLQKWFLLWKQITYASKMFVFKRKHPEPFITANHGEWKGGRTGELQLFISYSFVLFVFYSEYMLHL